MFKAILFHIMHGCVNVSGALSRNGYILVIKHLTLPGAVDGCYPLSCTYVNFGKCRLTFFCMVVFLQGWTIFVTDRTISFSPLLHICPEDISIRGIIVNDKN